MEQENEKLTITLTGRAPVRITKEGWPVIASSSDSWHDNQYECQANRKKNWRITVRQHIDGERTIVYAVYTYSSQYQGEDGADIRGGEMFTATEGDTAPIVSAIFRVAADMQERSGEEEFSRLAHECVADLPAVEV